MARQPKGRPAITGPDKNGDYNCYMPTGEFYADGRPKRKRFHRKDKDAVKVAIDEWEELRRQGGGLVGPIETVAQWMAYYTEHVIRPDKAYATWRDVECLNRLYFTPIIGRWRLKGTRNRLEPEHLDALFNAMRAARDPQLSDLYVRRAFRVLSRALKIAMRRRKADRNVCDMIEPPKARKAKPRPLSQDNAVKVLAGALEDEDYLAARVPLGVIAGPRQGEVLGLRWPRVELDPPGDMEPFVWIAAKLERRTWEHGCKDPVECVRARKVCRTKPCPPRYEHGCPPDARAACKMYAHFCPQKRRIPGCATHKSRSRPDGFKQCPPPCRPKCTDHARLCGDRKGGGLVESATKSEASEAPMAIGGTVGELLRRHRERQQKWFSDRGEEWDPEGFVFIEENGKPIDPRKDWERWRALLERVGVPHHKLHSGRHTAGTMLRAIGADLRLIQEQLRQADTETAAGYVEVALQAQQDAVNKVAAALLDGELTALLVAQRDARRVALQ